MLGFQAKGKSMLVGNTVLSDVGTIKKITSVKLYSGFSCFDPKGSTAGGFVDRSGEFQASPRAVQDEIMIVAFSELNLLVIGVYAFTDQGWGGKSNGVPDLTPGAYRGRGRRCKVRIEGAD
jgi:hypothetical protein